MTQRGVIASAQLMREARAPRSKASTGVCSRAHGTRAIVIQLSAVRVSCVYTPAHTGHGQCPSYSSYRVAKRSSDRSLAQRPLPEVPQRHPRVAKRASIGTLARRPSTEALLGQGHVPKGRKSVPLTGLWSGSRPGLARHPRLKVVLRQGRVPKGTSIGTSARRPYPQMPQWHPRGATVSWCIGE